MLMYHFVDIKKMFPSEREWAICFQTLDIFMI